MLCALMICATQSRANPESEPNNSKATANILALNGSNTGAIGISGDEDWYAITTTKDGKLDVTISVSNSLILYCYIYDNDGTTILNSGYSLSTTTISKDGLSPGTYYIKLNAVTNGQLPAYTVSNVFTEPALANDAEPNNTFVQAKTLAQDFTTTGHVGYYYNLQRDTADWYTITTNADGRLRLTLTPSTGANVYITLYDNNGTTSLGSVYNSGKILLNVDGLAAGTYYVKVNCYSPAVFTTYTLEDSLFKPAQANDIESNNTPALAQLLAQDDTTTGHVGYYYNLQKDTADWYKIITHADGLLRLTLTSGNGNNTSVYLYDNNGTTILGSRYTTTTGVLNVDGLSAGTYYIKVNCFAISDFAPYILADSLFTPAQANDIEPNNTRAQAINLAQDITTTGHVGYYYNLQRDTTDWYTITTNADGRLRLTLTPSNNTNTYITLYDNNGTTSLGSVYSSVKTILNIDGLAAGTYYVKINCYSPGSFAPYTLADSLFQTAQANDAEPNNMPAQAIVLPQDNSITGHVGYYYNLQRDTADWYKITTNADGLLRLTLTPANGISTYVYLYDNNGTSILGTRYSNTTGVLSVDGLAAGTYYVKVNCFATSDFASYTLADSLFSYSYSKDAEENVKPYLAKTILSNTFTDGHVGFYYDNKRDTTDWFKINYTGSGNLAFTINQETIKSGGANNLYFQVYKDTAAAAIHSSYSSATSRIVNLTALTQGYYWIKIFAYSSAQFSSYSFSNSFTQGNVAKITAKSYDTLANCLSTNSISFQASKSVNPYSAQLYRFGVPFGAPVITTKKVTFSNLPTGSYYATVYGDGATGTAFGKSKIVSVEPVPVNLNTTNTTNIKATLNWNTVTCAGYYTIQYRVQGNLTWTTKKTVNTTPSYLIKGLTASTTYEWQVATSDSANGIVATGAYSSISTFTTASAFSGGNNGDEVSLFGKGNTKEDNNSVAVFPNPASNYFTISYSSTKIGNVNAMLYNMNGKAVWTSGAINASALNGQRVTVSQFASGLYYLKIMDEKGAIQSVIKVSIIK